MIEVNGDTRDQGLGTKRLCHWTGTGGWPFRRNQVWDCDHDIFQQIRFNEAYNSGELATVKLYWYPVFIILHNI